MLVEIIPGMDWFSGVTTLLGLAYLLVAMKRIYQQGWGKTVLKYFLILFSFGLCLSVGMAINLAFTLIFI
jgi:hypothetical protein